MDNSAGLKDAHERQLGRGPKRLVRFSGNFSTFCGVHDHAVGRPALPNSPEDGRFQGFWSNRSLVVEQKSSPVFKLPILRYYFIVVLFLSFVFLTIPRIDFFLSAFLFLVVFITSFYLDDAMLLKKLFFFYLTGIIVLILYFALGLNDPLGRIIPFPADILTLCFIVSYSVYVWMLIRGNPLLRKKYRTAMIVAFVSPFVVGMIFKYFLLVPMPSEGLVVAVTDYFWYLEF